MQDIWDSNDDELDESSVEFFNACEKTRKKAWKDFFKQMEEKSMLDDTDILMDQIGQEISVRKRVPYHMPLDLVEEWVNNCNSGNDSFSKSNGSLNSSKSTNNTSKPCSPIKGNINHKSGISTPLSLNKNSVLKTIEENDQLNNEKESNCEEKLSIEDNESTNDYELFTSRVHADTKEDFKSVSKLGLRCKKLYKKPESLVDLEVHDDISVSRSFLPIIHTNKLRKLLENEFQEIVDESLTFKTHNNLQKSEECNVKLKEHNDTIIEFETQTNNCNIRDCKVMLFRLNPSIIKFYKERNSLSTVDNTENDTDKSFTKSKVIRCSTDDGISNSTIEIRYCSSPKSDKIYNTIKYICNKQVLTDDNSKDEITTSSATKTTFLSSNPNILDDVRDYLFESNFNNIESKTVDSCDKHNVNLTKSELKNNSLFELVLSEDEKEESNSHSTNSKLSNEKNIVKTKLIKTTSGRLHSKMFKTMVNSEYESKDNLLVMSNRESVERFRNLSFKKRRTLKKTVPLGRKLQINNLNKGNSIENKISANQDCRMDYSSAMTSSTDSIFSDQSFVSKNNDEAETNNTQQKNYVIRDLSPVTSTESESNSKKQNKTISHKKKNISKYTTRYLNKCNFRTRKSSDKDNRTNPIHSLNKSLKNIQSNAISYTNLNVNSNSNDTSNAIDKSNYSSNVIRSLIPVSSDSEDDFSEQYKTENKIMNEVKKSQLKHEDINETDLFFDSDDSHADWDLALFDRKKSRSGTFVPGCSAISKIS